MGGKTFGEAHSSWLFRSARFPRLSYIHTGFERLHDVAGQSSASDNAARLD